MAKVGIFLLLNKFTDKKFFIYPGVEEAAGRVVRGARNVAEIVAWIVAKLATDDSPISHCGMCGVCKKFVTLALQNCPELGWIPVKHLMDN